MHIKTTPPTSIKKGTVVFRNFDLVLVKPDSFADPFRMHASSHGYAANDFMLIEILKAQVCHNDAEASALRDILSKAGYSHLHRMNNNEVLTFIENLIKNGTLMLYDAKTYDALVLSVAEKTNASSMGTVQAAQADAPSASRSKAKAANTSDSVESGSISGAEATSMALDATPVVSNVKSAFELFTGADAITGEPVSRWVALLGIVPVLGNIVKGGKIVAKAAGKVTKQTGVLGNKIRSPKNSKVCTNGCPISMISGEELLEQVDFTLPGPIPLVWNRTYRSSHTKNHGLGVGWSAPWFACLEIGEHDVTYYDGEGRAIPFARPDVHDACHNPLEKLTLYCDHEHLYRVVSDENIVYTFCGSGKHQQLWEMADSAGHAVTLHYNARHRLDVIRDSAGRYLKLGYITDYTASYTTKSLLHTVTLCDSDGHLQDTPLVTYTYSPDNDLIQVQDAAQQAQHYAYQNHVITQRTTADGFHFYFTWDQYTPAGKCIRSWGDNAIYDYRFDYDVENRITRSTDGRGNTTVYHYNHQGLILQETDAEGGITHYRYDDNGDLILQRDPAGNATQFTYDADGRLASVTDALGQHTALQYDAKGHLTQLRDALGQAWQRRYDWAGRVIQATDPAGNTTYYRYNSQGLPVNVTDALGVSQTLQWNRRGQLVAQTDGEGQKTQYRYDHLGRITQVIDHQGHTTHYDTDAVGNVIRVRQPEGGSITLSYTPEGRLTGYTDALNRRTEYQYDGLSQPVLRIDPQGKTLRYEYDKERNLTALINENGDRYQFEYDKNERLIKETGFDGREQVYQYNRAGHLQRHLDGKQRTTEFTRDPLGRLLEKHSNDGETARFAYDPLGRLIDTSNPATQLIHHYDPVGNLIAESQNGQRTVHAYDAVGQRTQTTLPTGQTLDYDYNRQGMFTRVALDGDTVTQVERDQQGLEVQRHLGAITAQREYDPMGRLVLQRSGKDSSKKEQHPVLARHYRYDLAGNLQQIDDVKHGKTVFQYDALDRLSAVDGLNPEQFHFDPAGNLLDNNNASPAQGGRVQGNRLRVFQDYRFEYDDVGNLILEKKGKHTTQFTYNAQNQLTHVAKAGQQFEYRYDPFGRRISKKDAFGETTYLWDGDTLISEQRKQLQTTYIYEPGSFIPLCQVRDKTIYYYHNDHIGTPQLLTDRQGEVVWQARYQVYGNVVQYEVEAIENPLRFQGQYFDAETGLHYNRHRYYHPVIGRFTSVDPIGLEGGNNSYEYAPNPVSWVDPLGLSCKELGVTKKGGAFTPDRKLPSTKHGDPIPDVDLPHSQLGRNASGDRAAREWMPKEGGGITATRRIDFSDHGTPNIHPNPHQHRLVPNNPKLAPKGGYSPGKAESLQYP